ncbi:MAG: RDD family protein [Lentisphaeria bacterium]
MVKDHTQYVTRLPDGTEWPPLPAEALLERARQGQLTAACEVRNVLVRNWKKAAELSWLAPALLEYSPDGGLANAAAPAGDREVAPGMAYRVTLGQSGFHCTPGGWSLRLAAGLTDLGLLAVVAALVLLLTGAGGAPNAAASAALAAGIALGLGGGAFLVGCNAQTPGQWFWGLLTVSAEGRELFYGRAFLFVLCSLALGWLTPFVQPLSPERRGPAEWLSATRVVRTRLCHGDILKV